MTSLKAKFLLDQDLRRYVFNDKNTLNLLTLRRTAQELYTLSDAQATSLSIKYHDDENDLVTIATESDLKEAVALYQTLPGTIRLSLFLESSNSSTNATQPNFAESIQDLLRNVLGGAGVSAGTPPANFFAHLAGMFKPGDDVSPTDLFANLSAMLNNPALEAHLEELSNVFKEGSCKGPSQKEQCPGSFCESGFVQRMKHRGKYFALHRQAIQEMDGGNPQNLRLAIDILLTQLEVTEHLSPDYRASPLYNLACCYSLLNEVDTALDYLTQAFEFGWDNSEHTANDEDLANLRSNEEFESLITRMRLKQEDHQEKAKETEKKEESSPSISTPAPTPSPLPQSESETNAESSESLNSLSKSAALDLDAKLNTLDEMGWTDRRANIQALLNAKGDLVTAIQFLLG